MSLLDMSFDELQKVLVASGFEKYRCSQVFNWLMRGVLISDMSNLSTEIKSFLSQFGEGYLSVTSLLKSSDGTYKYAFELSDGNIIESVLMKKNYGNTVCLSTQVGCRMGCIFCASCKNGFIRNLSAGEILSQYIFLNSSLGNGRNITNIVLMGMGEPLDNYDEVLKFLKLINDERTFNFSLRNISLSTCGLVDKINKFSYEHLPVNLCISLHAADELKRNKIMPVSRKWKIDELISAAENYFSITGRRLIFEYIVIKNFNDTTEDVDNLFRLLGNLNCHINLIPLNRIEGYDFEVPSKKEAYSFACKLQRKGLSATVRLSQGSDILGACGQLRGSIIKGKS